MLDQRGLAIQIAMRQALIHERLSQEAVIASERTAHKTTAKQLVKAAAELARMNVPVSVTVDGVDYYIVESRSIFNGKIIEMDVDGTMFEAANQFLLAAAANIMQAYTVNGIAKVPNGTVSLKFAVSGGEPYLVNPVAMTCTCEKGGTCWHSAEVDCWIDAGHALNLDDIVPFQNADNSQDVPVPAPTHTAYEDGYTSWV